MHSLCRARHFDELPLSEEPISTHVATRSPSSASTQVFLPTTTPSCNCNTDTAHLSAITDAGVTAKAGDKQRPFELHQRPLRPHFRPPGPHKSGSRPRTRL